MEESITQESTEKTVFGFWVYLMTDCILFGTLFATYVVLRNNTFGGPSGRDLFNLNFVLGETLILLISSFTCGLAMLAAHANNRKKVFGWIGMSFLLGIAFLTMELKEFIHLVHQGNSWQKSGFLSAFFTLVGTHGLHITVGLLWMIFLVAEIVFKGLIAVTLKRLTCLSMFWHFLDVVWIFIFTIVYLMGVI